ncbi:MAG: hypothetical protein EBR12_05610 [Proteobacteria bacterium]|nr:hypothetical protein [Pseudomonadota bacterium]
MFTLLCSIQFREKRGKTKIRTSLDIKESRIHANDGALLHPLSAALPFWAVDTRLSAITLTG